jgi:hypothetical protein
MKNNKNKLYRTTYAVDEASSNNPMNSQPATRQWKGSDLRNGVEKCTLRKCAPPRCDNGYGLVIRIRFPGAEGIIAPQATSVFRSTLRLIQSGWVVKRPECQAVAKNKRVQCWYPKNTSTSNVSRTSVLTKKKKKLYKRYGTHILFRVSQDIVISFTFRLKLHVTSAASSTLELSL